MITNYSRSLKFADYNENNVGNFQLITPINNNPNYHSDIIPKDNNIIMQSEKISNESIITNQIKINKKPCGIINYGNNCYLNSGLQILFSWDKLIEELDNIRM